ncbi:hypothetical protein ACFV3R_20535 [Streptomyces sp. NPDC059740]|uniref:SCO4983 family protein n=1 Tax=Streptomyces sp. NPDC059740 TaxID=3346926 RepID=UPI0036515985
MYEPIRTPSVHRMAAEPGVPHRSRDEELDIRLAGHLTALLTVTDELRAVSPGEDLDRAAERIAELVTRLNRGRAPLRAAPSGDSVHHPFPLHQRARTLAGNALSVATARDNVTAMELSTERMEAHAAALDLTTAA